MKVRGPFNRIVDFIWNGLDHSENEDCRKIFKETLCNPEYSDWCCEHLLSAAFCGDYFTSGYAHVKGTYGLFINMGHCDTMIYSKKLIFSKFLRDLYMSKLGVNTPIYINPIQKIIDGVPHMNMAYKYTNNDDIIAEFDILCAKGIDAGYISSNVALRFGIDIKIQITERWPDLMWSYNSFNGTRFGKIKSETWGLYTAENLWDCPYPDSISFIY
jgi:hypothetical protein